MRYVRGLMEVVYMVVKMEWIVVRVFFLYVFFFKIYFVFCIYIYNNNKLLLLRKIVFDM